MELNWLPFFCASSHGDLNATSGTMDRTSDKTIHTENVKMYLYLSSVASEQPQQAPAPVFWREIKNKCCRNNSNLQLGKDTLLIYLCLCRLVCKKKKYFCGKSWLCFLVTCDHNLLSSVCVCIPVCAAQTLYTLLPVHTHTHTHPTTPL